MTQPTQLSTGDPRATAERQPSLGAGPKAMSSRALSRNTVALELVDQPHPAVMVARPEEFLRAARLEGEALRRSLEDPVVRPWAPDAINAWERRVERLIERDLGQSPERGRGGPVIGSASGDGGYEPGGELWWLEFRIDRRMEELDRIMAVLGDGCAANGADPGRRMAGSPWDSSDRLVRRGDGVAGR
jgi:hypothetical protein